MSEQRSAGSGSCPRDEACARPEQGEAGAVDYAIEHSFVREAVVPERKLATEALKRGLGSVTVEGVQREVDKPPADPQRSRRPRDGDDQGDARPGKAS